MLDRVVRYAKQSWLSWRVWIWWYLLLFIINVVILYAVVNSLQGNQLFLPPRQTSRQRQQRRRQTTVFNQQVTPDELTQKWPHIPPAVVPSFASMQTNVFGEDFLERHILYPALDKPSSQSTRVLLLTFPNILPNLSKQILAAFPHHTFYTTRSGKMPAQVNRLRRTAVGAPGTQKPLRTYGAIYSLFDVNAIQSRSDNTAAKMCAYAHQMAQYCRKDGAVFLRMLVADKEHARVVRTCFQRHFHHVRVCFMNYQMMMIFNPGFLVKVIQYWQDCKFHWLHYGQLVLIADTPIAPAILPPREDAKLKKPPLLQRSFVTKPEQHKQNNNGDADHQW